MHDWTSIPIHPNIHAKFLVEPKLHVVAYTINALREIE